MASHLENGENDTDTSKHDKKKESFQTIKRKRKNINKKETQKRIQLEGEIERKTYKERQA